MNIMEPVFDKKVFTDCAWNNIDGVIPRLWLKVHGFYHCIIK